MQLNSDNRKPELCSKTLCTACTACYSICPKDAIDMVAGNDGFFHPVINDEKCIRCMACENACPILKKGININRYKEPSAYACWNKDELIRKESSSGGVFSAIARTIIEDGGVVSGAIYTESMKVAHIVCNDIQGLSKLRGSKYVQSELGDTFRKIRSLLQNGKLVLFVGTPCQVEGLRSFLRKDYDNLYCCDFICHGTPSPLLFQKYIHFIEKNIHIRIKSLNFRNKKKGWQDFLRSVNNSNTILKGRNDCYVEAFYGNFAMRESCYNCPAIGIPRKGDLTIADYWGIGTMYKFEPNFEIERGVSLILVNNSKGMDLMTASEKYLHVKKGAFNEALKGNQAMVRPPYRPKSRDYFYIDLVRLDFQDVINKYLNPGFKGKVIRYMKEYTPYKILVTIRNVKRLIQWKRNGGKSLSQ